jgi:hypothetical protein
VTQVQKDMIANTWMYILNMRTFPTKQVSGCSGLSTMPSVMSGGAGRGARRRRFHLSSLGRSSRGSRVSGRSHPCHRITTQTTQSASRGNVVSQLVKSREYLIPIIAEEMSSVIATLSRISICICKAASD